MEIGAVVAASASRRFCCHPVVAAAWSNLIARFELALILLESRTDAAVSTARH
jgi:hypothetical protein